MNVVRHQAIRQYLHIMLVRILLQPSEISSTVFVNKKDALLAISPLCNMVRDTAADGSGKTRHAWLYALHWRTVVACIALGGHEKHFGAVQHDTAPKKGCVPFFLFRNLNRQKVHRPASPSLLRPAKYIATPWPTTYPIDNKNQKALGLATLLSAPSK